MEVYNVPQKNILNTGIYNFGRISIGNTPVYIYDIEAVLVQGTNIDVNWHTQDRQSNAGDIKIGGVVLTSSDPADTTPINRVCDGNILCVIDYISGAPCSIDITVHWMTFHPCEHCNGSGIGLHPITYTEIYRGCTHCNGSGQKTS